MENDPLSIENYAKLLLPAYYRQGVDAIPDLDQFMNLDSENPYCYVKLFDTIYGWQWHVMAWDGEYKCYGLIKGYEVESGYFDLRTLSALRFSDGEGLSGWTLVQRDITFKKTKYRELYMQLKEELENGPRPPDFPLMDAMCGIIVKTSPKELFKWSKAEKVSHNMQTNGVCQISDKPNTQIDLAK